MRDIAITLIVFVGLIYTLKRPHLGILLWSWLGYMNPHRLAYGFAYSAPFAQITAIVTMLSLLLSKEKKTFPFTFTTFIWLAFIVHVSISTIFSVFPDAAIDQLIKVYKIQLVIFLTLLVINNKERINQLVWVISMSIGFYSIKGGVFTLLTGGGHLVWGPSGSFIQGNNEIGLATLMVLPLFVYLRNQTNNKWLKQALLAFILLSIFTVLGTHSRGAFLGLAAMLFFLWLKMSNKIITGFFGMIFIVIALAFMPTEFYERMNTIETYEEDASAMGRINAWTLAIKISNDRFYGGGFDHWSTITFAQYAPIPNDVHDAHSIYFEVLGEHGYLGLLLFLLILLLTWRNASWIILKTKNNPELFWCNDLARMIQVSMVAYTTGGAFLGLAYWDLPYHFVAIVVIMRKIVEKNLNSSKSQPKLTHNNNAGIIEKKKWAWEK